MSVLTIHSHVSVGHIGNGAAAFVLQRLGHDVWPVHTVLLSQHPGHGGWHGPRISATDVAAVIDGFDGHGVLGTCRAVLTGYVGSVAVGDVACDAWARVRAANPDALIACDPILGDETEGLYVAEDLIAFYRDKAVPAADVIFPNRFELALLSGVDVTGPESAVTAARMLMADGPAMVVATSIPAGDGLASVLVTDREALQVRVPRLDVRAKGAGDVFCAMWLSRHLDDPGDAAGALAGAANGTRSVLERAADRDLAELPLVDTQALWSAAAEAAGDVEPV